MAKISFITVHVGTNFGSNLQAIATYNVLRELGHDPLLIDYIPERVTAAHYWKEAVTSPVRFVRRFLAAPNFYINTKIYNDFLHTHCKMSKSIYDADDFAIECPKADVYLTGSDQVWNSKHNRGLNKRYYYDGIKGRKVSYASSFGVEELPQDEKLQVKQMLSDFAYISVREASAVDIVQSMGYNAVHLIDPTFMLDRNRWCQYMTKRNIKGPYLLLYLPYNIVDAKLIYETAHEIANEKGLRVVTFSWDFRSETMADGTIKYASPGDFLSLMDGASFVITNSFHGTAFSLNLNKQFVVFLPSGFGTRIVSVLNLCEQSSRLVSNKQQAIEQSKKTIDYNIVNDILDKERLASMKYLEASLK